MGKRVTKKVKAKSSKVKSTVKLPTDRTGAPIHIGDLLEWEDGTRFEVAWLSYFGDDMWTAESEDGVGFSDNLDASLIVWRKRKEKK